MPFLITPENPCLCPFVICQEKGFDEAQIAFQQGMFTEPSAFQFLARLHTLGRIS